MSGNSDLWYLCEALGITVVVLAIEVLFSWRASRATRQSCARKPLARKHKARS
jgi:hypothetical protein